MGCLFFFFHKLFTVCRKFGPCGTREEQILVQSIERFAAREGVVGVLQFFLLWSCAAKQVSWRHSCGRACVDLLVLMPLYFRISHNLFLFFRGSPALLRCMTNSSTVGVGARSTTTAVFNPPATDIHFELSPVPPNPLGDGRRIKTAAALVIGCVVCREWSLFTELAE